MRRIKKIDRQKTERHAGRIGETFEDGDGTLMRMDDLCGTWESVNLNPSLIIYRDRSRYMLSVIHVAESGQAAPSTCEIEREERRCLIKLQGRPARLSYDPLRDELSLEGYGSYLRND